MAAFSASEAAFEGFRITRERPVWILAWSGLYFLMQLGIFGIMAALAGSAFTDLMSASAAGVNADPARTLEIYQRLAPAYALILPIALIASTVFVCAIYRAALRPTDPAFFGMRLGGDEFRVLLVSIAILLLFVVIWVVGIVALALVGGGVGAAAGEGAGIAAAVILGFALAAALIFFGVRLSLATVMTFSDREFRVFESWRATQGRFWPLLGAYLLAFVLTILVSLLFSIVLFGIIFGVAAAMGEQLQGSLASMTNPMAMMTTFGPVMVIYLIVNSIISVITNTILFSPPAAAWRQISGTAQVFA